MVDLALLAERLAEATDPSSAAEWFAEQVVASLPGAAVRVFLLGPGDRCSTCPRLRDCAARDRCLHLAGGVGAFAAPPGSAERIPRKAPPWAQALQGGPQAALADEIAAPEGEARGAGLLIPFDAAGERIGLLAVRTPAPLASQGVDRLKAAASLAAATLRLLASRRAERRVEAQLLLVNDLGRKLNAILDAKLLLRQVVTDVQRTFGFHNVMILMVDPARRHLVLEAQASSLGHVGPARGALPLGTGIVGRVAKSGLAETVDDVTRDPDFVGWFDDTRSEIAIPILVEGLVEGVLNVESDRVGAFGPIERLVLETVANQLAIALENARLFGMVREREDRYRTLVECSPGAVLHLDRGGHVIYANPAVSEITGLSKTDLLERRAALASLTGPDERATVEAAVQAALSGVPRRDVEFSVVRGDGVRRWVNASLQPLLDAQGETQGVVVVAGDRTEERELQERLRQSEKLSSMGTLVSGVAHELNNPLAGILGYAQLLLNRPEEQWTRADLEKIEKNARRCQRIVENLLAFSRQSRTTKRLASLNDVVESVIRLNEYQFQMDNVQIQGSFDPRVPPLYIDVNRWQQVFVNLATNAREAMVAAGSPRRVLRFETRMSDETLLIRATDTGPGVPEGLRSRIFDPFFTTKETGTGLGLGICWGIVRDHGGTIELEPSDGEGAAFLITLPTRRPEVAPVEPVVPEGPLKTDLGVGRRVLVVDDDATVRDVVVRTLENHRYSVDVASDGRRALEHVRAAPYDAVLTDVRMPGEMDGVAFFERLREELPHLASGVVFLTGNTLDDDGMERLTRLGVRCIEKPFDIHHLARVIHDVASRPRAQGAPEEGPR